MTELIVDLHTNLRDLHEENRLHTRLQAGNISG